MEQGCYWRIVQEPGRDIPNQTPRFPASLLCRDCRQRDINSAIRFHGDPWARPLPRALAQRAGNSEKRESSSLKASRFGSKSIAAKIVYTRGVFVRHDLVCRTSFRVTPFSRRG